MADLNSAISRLEEVTSRLLRFEAKLGQAPASAVQSAAPKSTAAPSAANGSPATLATGGSAAELAAYDHLLSEQLQPLMTAAAAVGGEVLEGSKLVEKAFKEQRTVLVVASKAKQPEPAQLQAILQPVAEPMMAAAAQADNRRSPVFQQNKVLAEALQALSWLAYTGPSCGMHTPGQHISESWNSAEFYANKLLKEFKGVDENQVNWVKAVKDLFTALQRFVSTNYPMGLKWNPSGSSNVAEALAAAQAAGATPSTAATKGPAPATRAPGGAKGPPPPAPPPPPGLKDMLLKERPSGAAVSNGNSSGGAGGAGMADLLSALNKGSAVTSGLRKVTDNMKAKNRTDRSGVVSAGTAAANSAAPKSAAQAAAAAPPRFELEQERKWVIENQIGQQELIVNIKDPKQSVYIYNCSGTVVQVKGKCNAISVDKCKKTGVVYESVIAACEMVNCSSIQVQCTDISTAPTMSIDKCDGVQLYIPAALAANPDLQVVTAKSSEVNILVVATNPEAEDVAEHAVPEQFISTFVDGKLVTVAASHGGG